MGEGHQENSPCVRAQPLGRQVAQGDEGFSDPAGLTRVVSLWRGSRARFKMSRTAELFDHGFSYHTTPTLNLTSPLENVPLNTSRLVACVTVRLV